MNKIGTEDGKTPQEGTFLFFLKDLKKRTKDMLIDIFWNAKGTRYLMFFWLCLLTGCVIYLLFRG